MNASIIVAMREIVTEQSSAFKKIIDSAVDLTSKFIVKKYDLANSRTSEGGASKDPVVESKQQNQPPLLPAASTHGVLAVRPADVETAPASPAPAPGQ
jgi:hypothetical protein